MVRVRMMQGLQGNLGMPAHRDSRHARTITSSYLRLLYVVARYPPYLGGTELHTYQVGRRLAALGHTVTVLTTDPAGTLPSDEWTEGIHIQRVRAWPSRRDYYLAPGIYRPIMSDDWDLIHCQGCHNLVPPLAMIAAWRARVPYVVSFHTGGHASRFRGRLRPLQWVMLRPLLAHADHLIAVSTFEEELFRRLLRLPSEQFSIIPNGGDLVTSTDQPAILNGNKLIVSVGRLERYKGHHRIIAAMPTVLAHVPDARLRIVGSGPTEAELRRLTVQLGIEDHVEIEGIHLEDRAEMGDLLSQAALVALLSDYEANPIAAMETIALQRPLLVTYASGLAELVDRGLAQGISTASSPREVANAIIRNLRTPMTLTRAQPRTWDECAADLLSLYFDIVRERRCAS
jgi:glycogen synthase